MAKTLILDSHTGSRIPFLRGILTHSLQNSGMEFDSAYALSSVIRDKIEGSSEITSLDLRDLVTTHLHELGEIIVLQVPDILLHIERSGCKYTEPMQAPKQFSDSPVA